jgi:hypothetical protein
MNIQFSAEQSALLASNRLAMAGKNEGISDAFRAQLTSALESALERLGMKAGQISISPDPASTTGQQRQNLVESANPLLSSLTVLPAAAPAHSIAAPETSTSTTGSLTAAAVDSTSPENDANYDDAYWAAQPAAVQQLRDIPDPEKRGALATQLAAEGYKIDVPIMMWGWDPAKTMAMRVSDGYTWVPSAYQNPVEVAPGINFPPGKPYDPNNPPPDSIRMA